MDRETALQQLFAGHEPRDCGEHRTTGGRAWCFECTEWCSPRRPCKGCELPALRRRMGLLEALLIEGDQLIAHLTANPDELYVHDITNTITRTG